MPPALVGCVLILGSGCRTLEQSGSKDEAEAAPLESAREPEPAGGAAGLEPVREPEPAIDPPTTSLSVPLLS